MDDLITPSVSFEKVNLADPSAVSFETQGATSREQVKSLKSFELESALKNIEYGFPRFLKGGACGLTL
ncbi:MAG: hypothetical protein ABIK68_23595 [bacterium]